jgi:hypothetical protein
MKSKAGNQARMVKHEAQGMQTGKQGEARNARQDRRAG